MAKIPIILESGRADGKLVTSNAIFDENKGMFQSDINDIQDTLNSDNPNKPLSANQGKILKKILDTKVIEVGAVPIDAEPTEGNITHVVNSDGLAKKFNKCNTEITQRGIYDVSAHNNGAVFESLSDLLNNANLNTLIPISVRYGGMSIRFIQETVSNSDNKYVQYRLMSTTWSTTVADWQGVDAEPTAESENLVQSGGVFGVVKNIKDTDFNSDTQEWEFDGTEYILAGQGVVFLPYLGKTDCEITVDFEGSNSFIVSAMSKNSSSEIRLYNSSKVSVEGPVIFNNPRPDIELINVRIYVNKSLGTAGTFNMKIKKRSPIKANKISISNNAKEISYLNSQNNLLKYGVGISITDTSNLQPLKLKQGVKYLLKSNVSATITLFSEDQSTIIQTINVGSLYINQFIKFVLVADSYFVKSGIACNIEVIEDANPTKLSSRISEIENKECLDNGYLFNQDTQDWKFKKSLYCNPNSDNVFLSYLGKTACEITIDCSNSNITYIRVVGTNIATNNQVNLYESSEVSFPVTFNNPRTDLEFKDIKIIIPSTFTTRDEYTMNIKKISLINTLNNQVATINKNVVNVEIENGLMTNGVDINLPNGSTYQHIPFKVGNGYKLTTTSNDVRTLTIWNYTKTEIIKSFTSASKGNSVVITVDNNNGYWLKAGNTFTGVLSFEKSIGNNDMRITAIETDTVLKHEYLFAQDTQDWVYENSVSVNAGGETDITGYIGKGDFKVTLNGTIATNKIRVLGLNVATNKWIDIFGSPNWNVVTFPITFNNSRPEIEFSKLKILVAANGGNTDTISVLIKKISPIKLLNEKTDISSLLQARLNSPFYQFGIGIDCKYETPQVDALSLPSQGERVSYFHSLYDELVSLYPTYVSKIDCDLEYAQTPNAMTRPSELSSTPIYMYKFIPAYTPKSVEIDQTETMKSRLKVFIVTGTHSEYMAIWDCYQTMKRICESWATNDNLDVLRHEAEYYVIPCSGPWGIDNGSRVNYNGVDLNRNAPASNWILTENNGYTYSGSEPASEYETKILVYYMKYIKPQVFIDHHNANKSNNKNLMYITSKVKGGLDVGAAHISDMTRRWKKRYNTIFPNDDVIYGFAQKTLETGTRVWYGCDMGTLGFTYESNQDLLYTNGEYTPSNPRNFSDPVTCTLATDGFLNFLLRVLKTYSEML